MLVEIYNFFCSVVEQQRHLSVNKSVTLDLHQCYLGFNWYTLFSLKMFYIVYQL